MEARYPVVMLSLLLGVVPVRWLRLELPSRTSPLFLRRRSFIGWRHVMLLPGSRRETRDVYRSERPRVIPLTRGSSCRDSTPGRRLFVRALAPASSVVSWASVDESRIYMAMVGNIAQRSDPSPSPSRADRHHYPADAAGEVPIPSPPAPLRWTRRLRLGPWAGVSSHKAGRCSNSRFETTNVSQEGRRSIILLPRTQQNCAEPRPYFSGHTYPHVPK